MNSSNKHLPAEERRAVTVEVVVELAGEQNPSEITTAAIAKRMGLPGRSFSSFPKQGCHLTSCYGMGGRTINVPH